MRAQVRSGLPRTFPVAGTFLTRNELVGIGWQILQSAANDKEEAPAE